jgi:hypothetical protein
LIPLPSRDIEKLWSLYSSIIEKIDDNKINEMIEDLGQSFVEHSYSLRTSEPFCGIGGILEYSLELAKTAKKLNESLSLGLDNKSLMRIALISEFGRIGKSSSILRFEENNSEWHKNNLGQYYNWNKTCPKYKTNEMTLYHLSCYNVDLSWEELNTIMLLGDYKELKEFYREDVAEFTQCLLSAQEWVLNSERKRIKAAEVLPF